MLNTPSHSSFPIFIGHGTTPQALASRLVYFQTYAVAVVLFVAYAATFVSFLAVRRHDLPFTDFSGMLEDGTYKLGVLSGSARVDFFKVILLKGRLNVAE